MKPQRKPQRKPQLRPFHFLPALGSFTWLKAYLYDETQTSEIAQGVYNTTKDYFPISMHARSHALIKLHAAIRSINAPLSVTLLKEVEHGMLKLKTAPHNTDRIQVRTTITN